MIYKLDHITYVDEKKNESSFLGINTEFLFHEKSLENIKIKKSFMHYDNIDHDIFFVKNREDKNFPIEYIFYDRVGDDTKVFVEGNKIHGNYSNAEGTIDMLSSLYGDKVYLVGKTIKCNLRGVLDSKDYYIELDPGEVSEVYLDSKGLGVITVWSKGCKFNDGCFEYTEREKVVVGGHELCVSFCRSPYFNIIFEIIHMD